MIATSSIMSTSSVHKFYKGHPHRLQSVKVRSLSKINEINERILALRHELRQTVYDPEIVSVVGQDQSEEILATINHLKTTITNHDPLEEMCEEEPHASECKMYDV